MEQIQTKLTNINEHLSILERQRSRSRENHHSSQLRLKSSLATQLTSTANVLNQSSKSRFINKYKSLISNNKRRKESFSSENSSESEVEETVVEDEGSLGL